MQHQRPRHSWAPRQSALRQSKQAPNPIINPEKLTGQQRPNTAPSKPRIPAGRTPAPMQWLQPESELFSLFSTACSCIHTQNQQWLQPESELFCLFRTEHEILSRAVLKTNPRDAVKPHSPLASALFRAIFPHKSFMTMQVIIRKSSRVIIVQFCVFV